MGFPGSSVGKKSTCNAGDLGSTPGSGRFTGAGIGYPLQYSGLENSMDYIVHEVAKNGTQLSDFHSLDKKICEMSKSIDTEKANKGQRKGRWG